MDLKRLRYFCTVVEQKSITRAAQILHISQPPLSKRLQELEAELNLSLLQRWHNQVEPTEAGAFLYTRAKHILQEVQILEKDLDNWRQNNSTTHIRLGISYLFHKFFQPLLFALQENKQQAINVFMGDSVQLLDMLRKEKLDMAWIQQIDTDLSGEIDYLALGSIELQVVVHQDLVKKQALKSKKISLTALGNLPLVMLQRSDGGGTFETLLQHLHQHGIHPQILGSASEPSVILDWLQSGKVCAALLPCSEIPAIPKPAYQLFSLQPSQTVFFPMIAKCRNKAWPAAIDQLIEQRGYPFASN